jgi:hypothetical protein
MPIITPVVGQSEQKAQTTGGSARERALARFAQNEAPKPEAPAVSQLDAAPRTSVTEPTPNELAAAVTASLPKDEAASEAPIEAVDTPKEDPVLSRQFAELSRQERAMRARQQQMDKTIKEREAQLAAKEAELAKLEASYKSGYIPKDMLKTNPLQVLADNEVSYDELTQQLLNQSNPMDARAQALFNKMEAKIAHLEKQAEEFQNNNKTQQADQFQAAVKQISNDVESLVKSDDNYETIRASGAQQDVVDLIVKTFNEDGILMSVEEAAEEVENHILEEVVKLSQLSKVTKRTQKVAPSDDPKPTQTQEAQAKAQTQAPTMKTLTNAAASTRPLTARERAMMKLRGE